MAAGDRPETTPEATLPSASGPIKVKTSTHRKTPLAPPPRAQLAPRHPGSRVQEARPTYLSDDDRTVNPKQDPGTNA